TGNTTYTGPYDNTMVPANFKIWPGGAPNASLYAYKVFGCVGTVSDDIIVDAIEQAMTDGVNVINMSLGSAFGTGTSLDEQAVNNGSIHGITMVISAGNEGPSAYVVGGPGTADRALSVAAVDASTPTLPGYKTNGGSGPILSLSNDIPVSSDITAAIDYV